MRIKAIRGKLQEIPGALRDIPPGQQAAGEEQGVISHVLSTPDGRSEDEWREPEAGIASVDDEQDESGDGGDFDPVFEWGPESEETMSRLGQAADEAIRQSVQVQSGADALGHYLSFHYRGAQWGATVKASGVAWLVQHYFNALPADAVTKARLAFHAILQHELFHFATDIAISQAEMSQCQAWYLPASEARRRHVPSYSLREEQLANVWMLRAFRTALPGFRVRGKQFALKTFVQAQPPGYRDALTFRAERSRDELHELAYEYAELAGCGHDNPLLWGWGYEWASQFPVWPRIDWRNCAIHFVDDSARFGVPPGWLSFLSRLPDIEESDGFRKQLARLGGKQQERWFVAKRRAATGLTSGHDFKPWPKGGDDIWSIRVDRGFRAHLKRDRAGGKWIALEIGDHKTMGHG